MSVIICPFAEEHVPGAARLERECFAAPWSEDALREELNNPNALFLAALDDGETVGYLGCHLILDEGYIANVAVSPRRRHEGIGRQLVGALIERAKQSGAAFLTLEVRVSNLPAIALYLSMGFCPVGIRRGFYDRPREDAQLMTLSFEEEKR